MEKIRKLKNYFKHFKIDGYIVPKNDKFFGEYVSSSNDNLKYISNFSGSSGFAILLKNNNYIFVDGRYTIQANIESGRDYKICNIPNEYPFKIFAKKKLIIGFDPSLHTENSLKRLFFNSQIKLMPIEENLINKIWRKKKYLKNVPFYELKKKDAGESSSKKILKLKKIIRSNKVEYSLITASENVAWLLNIRGSDTNYSPLPHSHVLFASNGKIKLFCNLKQLTKSLKLSLEKKIKIYDFNSLPSTLLQVFNKKIQIDNLTCSIFLKSIIERNNIVSIKLDPIYYLKSLKNKTEIKNIIKCHLYDGAALTKFIFWLKNNYLKKKITEIDAQKKLLKFRKKNKIFKFLSFPTISGSGPNSAIIHYKASLKSNRVLKKRDIYLVDSGGQYLFGTTDVTRTLSLSNNNNKIREIFTRVLKGHIAVANYNLKQNTSGKQIDLAARKSLKKINLDYPHGTGHGVGYFLNVHEGPQAISRANNVKFKEGMVTSNEPGYYKKDHFGIRIENLIYVKKIKNKIRFDNLTLVPIEKDLINKKLLNSTEIKWINKYHSTVFKNLKKFMNKIELAELKHACSNI